MTNWRNDPSVMEKFRAIRLDDTMSDELELAALLDVAVAASGSPPPTPSAWAVVTDDNEVALASPVKREMEVAAEYYTLKRGHVAPLYLGASSGSPPSPAPESITIAAGEIPWSANHDRLLRALVEAVYRHCEREEGFDPRGAMWGVPYHLIEKFFPAGERASSGSTGAPPLDQPTPSQEI